MSFEPISLSMVDRVHAKNLYVCVRVDGENEQGLPCYAYFGLFVDDFQKMLQHLEKNASVKPKDFRGIVLARSTGEPSPEIREFMGMKFSFGGETEDRPPMLELSRIKPGAK